MKVIIGTVFLCVVFSALDGEMSHFNNFVTYFIVDSWNRIKINTNKGGQ